MGATMTAHDRTRCGPTRRRCSSPAMNNNLRTGMDLMIRRPAAGGFGAPDGPLSSSCPAGAGSVQINMPGPPGTTTRAPSATSTSTPSTREREAARRSSGGVATDMITTLAADSTFNDVSLTARNAERHGHHRRCAAVNIGTGPDRVVPGQLIMLEKGSYSILVQVTSIDAAAHKIFFAANDSLKLNQHTARYGSDGSTGRCRRLHRRHRPDCLRALPGYRAPGAGDGSGTPRPRGSG